MSKTKQVKESKAKAKRVSQPEPLEGEIQLVMLSKRPQEPGGVQKPGMVLKALPEAIVSVSTKLIGFVLPENARIQIDIKEGSYSFELSDIRGLHIYGPSDYDEAVGFAKQETSNNEGESSELQPE